MKPLPLINPQPPRLSTMADALARVEESGVFSNNGPEARAFEAEATAQLFDGKGACLPVANATLGLMIAIREAAREPVRAGALALMPAMTFAATAQAAHWAGLTPLICDIDPETWEAAPHAEERLLAEHAGKVSVIVPYATFGRAIDLERYAWLARKHNVGVVVDAAASLGTRDWDGVGFGSDAPFAVVFSMHATKTFAVAEGGLIHSGDVALVERLRCMANFGFTGTRSATLPGLNAKLSEITAVQAREKLKTFDAVCEGRRIVELEYRASLGGRYQLQPVPVGFQAMQFMPLLLPADLAHRRDAIAAAMAADGVGTGRYFSPHLGEQPWIRDNAIVDATPVADAIGARLLSLPITDDMLPVDARRVVGALDRACAAGRQAPALVRDHPVAQTLIVGGGPAGTAMLTAASKTGALPALVRAGLVLVERDEAIGGGRLGRYAITSDSTAQTFLTSVRDNPEPSLAALSRHPAALAVARHEGALGVPLVEVGPLLRATGDRLAEIVREHGGEVMTAHEAVSARRGADGLWRTTVRRRSDGHEIERVSRNLVIATGGHQPIDRLAAQQVAGAGLVAQAGDRLLQSDDVLSVGGFEKVADLLATKRAPRIAVIGGSTSALTTIALLLKGRPALPLGAGAITLLHRRPLRPFYPSVEAAHAEGFTDFGPDDICPVSGFVYRLAGFRLEARDLVVRMLGIDGRAPDPRVATHRISGNDAHARAVIAEADLVIAALGYRPYALPVEQADGTPLALAAHAGKPMVDAHCRVLDAAGAPVPSLYGIGLAAGFVPWGRLGGESSFSGQANGLWLWQNDVGTMIVDQLTGVAADTAEVRAA